MTMDMDHGQGSMEQRRWGEQVILGGSFLAYLVIGLLVSRMVFVRVLGDSPRHKYDETTLNYIDAIFLASLAFPLWPFFLVAMPLLWLGHRVGGWIGRPTPHEQKLAREQAQKEQEDEARKLAREYGLPDVPPSVPTDPPKPRRTNW